ncbi:MAG TPA: hypothetical protein VH560_15250 [Polyangia bacterium]|jgi:hypothetical protein|nr:hypothetical protein [Polyangia bacterium]
MATLDELQKQHEARLDGVIAELGGHGGESDFALVRALVHKAIHYAATRKTIQFCALATYLGEMIGHAHQLQHGSDQAAPAHHDVVH